MRGIQPVPALFVVYAKEIARVAEFYRRTLELPVIEEAPGFLVVGGDGVEIAIVRMAAALARETTISVPPRVREESPVKLSFLVDDLQRVETAAAEAGGGTKPIASAWLWRGQWHLDGHDPEGNPVQFRQLET